MSADEVGELMNVIVNPVVMDVGCAQKLGSLA